MSWPGVCWLIIIFYFLLFAIKKKIQRNYNYKVNIVWKKIEKRNVRGPTSLMRLLVINGNTSLTSTLRTN